MAEARVIEISADATHGLRRDVLRRDVPATDVSFAEDAWPGVTHLGVDVGGDLQAVSTWVPRDLPTELSVAASGGTPAVDRAIQLRGMAVARALQGTGIGGLLVEAGILRCADNGYIWVWARARDAALAFYVRHGFEVIGDGFIDANTQLPHHHILRETTRRTAR